MLDIECDIAYTGFFSVIYDVSLWSRFRFEAQLGEWYAPRNVADIVASTLDNMEHILGDINTK